MLAIICALEEWRDFLEEVTHPVEIWTNHKNLDVRATGHKTPGESSVILQIVVKVQLTSRRILRD